MTIAMIYPLAAMVLLTAVVQTGLFLNRSGAVKRGEADPKYYKTFQGENKEPRQAAQFTRHYINLFEMPVLFYAAGVASLATGLGGEAMVWAAWVFVAARVVHAMIHLGSNKIFPRIYAHGFAWCVVLVMWGILIFGASSAHAQEDGEEEQEPPTTIEELREAIVGVLEEYDVPSIGITIVDKSGPIYTDAIGQTNLETGQEATVESMYRIGSVSKMFVALAVLQLVEEGRLSLDDKLATLAPEIQFENKWEASDPIRVVHLLEHTTGWDDIHLTEYAHNDPTPATLKEGLDYHPHSRTSRWKPGSRMSYCNSGPPVAAYIVEKITGMTFESYVQQNLFDPMGMTTMTYLLTEAAAEHGVVSYNPANEPQDYWHILMRPSGSINASPADMAKFVQFYLNRGSVDGVPVISAASLDRMETVESTPAGRNGQEVGYGLHNYNHAHKGWVFRAHNGGVNGGLTELAYQPELGLGYAFMINSGKGNAFGEISDLIGDYLTYGVEPPVGRPAIPATAAHYELEGFYEPINPRQEISRFIDRVGGVQKLWFENSTLKRKAILDDTVTEYLPVSDNQYKHSKTGLTALTAVTDPLEGPVVHVGTLVLKPVSPAVVWGQIGVAGLWLLTIALSIPYALIWVVRRVRKKVDPGPTIKIRLWPLLAGVSVIAFVALFTQGAADPFSRLGEPTFWSVGILISTLAFAAFAILGVRDAVRFRHWAMNRGNYWFSTVSSSLHLIVAVYLAVYGVIGIMTWG